MMIAALMFVSIGMYAQNEIGQITVKPMVGANFSTMTKMRTSRMRVGAVLGVEGEYGFIKNLSLSAGLVYSMLGMTSSESDPNYPSYKFGYIAVPILANYYVYPGLAIKAGLQPAFNVSADAGTLNDDTNSFYFSIPVGASYEISDFIIDARYNLGVSTVFNPGVARHSWFSITLGYKFTL